MNGEGLVGGMVLMFSTHITILSHRMLVTIILIFKRWHFLFMEIMIKRDQVFVAKQQGMDLHVLEPETYFSQQC